MKEKRLRLSDRCSVLLALGILLAAGCYALLWPHAEFSDAERRLLSAAPSAPSLTAWTTDRETESWLSDRIPFRPCISSGLAVHSRLFPVLIGDPSGPRFLSGWLSLPAAIPKHHTPFAICNIFHKIPPVQKEQIFFGPRCYSFVAIIYILYFLLFYIT